MARGGEEAELVIIINKGNQSCRLERERSGSVRSTDGHKLGTSLNRGGAKIRTSDLRVDQVLGRVNWNARGFYEGFVALLRVVKIHPLQYNQNIEVMFIMSIITSL